MSEYQTVTVRLLDRDYQIACPSEERPALERAARSLDGRLRAIRDGGNVVGLERIVIMAALNLSYELQVATDRSDRSSTDGNGLQSLLDKVDRALEQFDQ